METSSANKPESVTSTLAGEQVLAEKIREAGAAIGVAEAALTEANERLEVLLAEGATLQFGVRIGSQVRDEKGREYIVARICSSEWDFRNKRKPRLYGNRVTKKGITPNRCSIWRDWEIVAGPDASAQIQRTEER